MTSLELDDLVVRHGGEIVASVVAVMQDDVPIEKIAVMLVHRSFRGYDEVRSWADEELHGLGPDGFVFGTLRKDARIAVIVEGMKTVARALDGEASERGFTLVILYDNDALIRHVELELREPMPMPMVKGGVA